MLQFPQDIVTHVDHRFKAAWKMLTDQKADLNEQLKLLAI